MGKIFWRNLEKVIFITSPRVQFSLIYSENGWDLGDIEKKRCVDRWRSSLHEYVVEFLDRCVIEMVRCVLNKQNTHVFVLPSLLYFFFLSLQQILLRLFGCDSHYYVIPIHTISISLSLFLSYPWKLVNKYQTLGIVDLRHCWFLPWVIGWWRWLRFLYMKQFFAILHTVLRTFTDIT